MNFLDTRTVLFGQLLTDSLCTIVLIFLWRQNRKRYPGLLFWVIDFAFQTTAALLIVLRGSIPDWISIGFSPPLVLAGALSGYLGLERFLAKRSSQVHNYILLGGFVLVHLYFSFIQLNLEARNLNVSTGLLFFCSQSVWLMLWRARTQIRLTRAVGWIYAFFCLVSLARILALVYQPEASNDLFKSGVFESLALVSYQLLLIALTFGQALLVNERLVRDVKTQEDKFTKAFYLSPNAIVMSRLSDGMIYEVNHSFEVITGYLASEAVGKTTLDVNIWPGETDRQQALIELSKGGVIQGKEFSIRTKSGRQVTGLYYAEKLMVDNEPVLLSTISDITDRKQAESEIQSLNESLEQRVKERTVQLEAANKELEAFAYSVSHDLRAPLRGIDGWSLALLEDYHDRLDAEGQKYLERVRSETHRMGQLIDDLLQLSRVTRSEMKSGTVDLSDLAQTINHRLKTAQPDRQMEVNIQPGLTAWGDTALLEIALTNLFDNAWKFTGKSPAARIEFGQTRVDGRAVFFVKDNGVGFDLATAPKLFEAFQRLHNASEFPGTGIGLATVQRIISRHGGQVWAEAQKNQGAAFFFTLEAAK